MNAGYYPDYDLIDRLERDRARQQASYVCPMWDWLKDFRDHFTAQGWWETTVDIEMQLIRMDPSCGLVIKGDSWTTCDACSGEIG